MFLRFFAVPLGICLFLLCKAECVANGSVVTDPTLVTSIVMINETRGNFGNIMRCHGVIISQFEILTSAECLQMDIGKMKVLAGVFNRSFELHSQMTSVNSCTVHYASTPGGRGVKFVHDIALCTLTQNLTFNEHVQKAEIPQKFYEMPEYATFIGWGRLRGTEFTSGTQMPYAVELKLLSEEACIGSFYANIIDWNKNTWLCARAKEELLLSGPCALDFGGPLLHTDGNGTRIVLGIFSWFPGTECTGEEPYLFTKIVDYTQWFRDVAEIIVEEGPQNRTEASST